jgi:hypothetical protein
MANTKYTKSYSTLGVFQDDNWEMIRAAYKRQIMRWHPDRLQDSDHRKIAEEKSKEINHAYQNLTNYYREFGVLPPDHTSEKAVTSTAQEKWTGPERHDYSKTNCTSSEESPQPRRRNYTKVVFAGIVIAIVIGYTISEPLILNRLGTNEMVLAGHPGRGLADGSFTTNQNGYDKANDSGAPPIAGISNNTTSTHAQHWTNIRQEKKYDLNSRANVIGKNTPALSDSLETSFDTDPTSPATSTRPAFITKGSSKDEVLALQGPPLRQTDTAWDYGLSRIYFQDGKVTGWYENPMNLLIVAR